MTREDLAAQASAVFGRFWQRALARSLVNPRTSRPVNERTVRRWAKGDIQVPPFVEPALAALRADLSEQLRVQADEEVGDKRRHKSSASGEVDTDNPFTLEEGRAYKLKKGLGGRVLPYADTRRRK